MLSHDAIRLETVGGRPLTKPEYRSDFKRREWAISGQDSWKLERRQSFQQPGNDSWQACVRGDWTESLRLIEAERSDLLEFQQKVEEHGITLYRVRVVEEPIVPYLQWELWMLRLRAECGERIRVVGPEQVSALEREQELPEVLTMGEDAVYRIIYTTEGVGNGAVLFEDRQLVADYRHFIRSLYDTGEDLHAYFDRHVAHLAPPRPE